MITPDELSQMPIEELTIFAKMGRLGKRGDVPAFDVIFDARDELLSRVAKLEAVRRAAKMAEGGADRILDIMRRQGLKLDNLDDPMQNLAFTIYTELVDITEKVEYELADCHWPMPERKETT